MTRATRIAIAAAALWASACFDTREAGEGDPAGVVDALAAEDAGDAAPAVDVAEAAEIPDSLDTAEAVEFPWEACAGDACATLCAACPVPTLQATANGNAVTNGDSFKVQTEFAFQAVVDAGPCGAPVEWSWTLVGPAASADRLTPDSTGPATAFTANVVGDYQFDVAARFADGCAPQAGLLVHAVPPPGAGCHLQLTWSTPLDADPTDQCGAGANCGSDLDLHVVDSSAHSGLDLDGDGVDDGFFDVGQDQGTSGDSFWYNPHPCWVTGQCADPNQQPSLDRDDTDGAGPENWTYMDPPAAACYRIGVHYWDDHGWGPSYPTLRVWAEDQLVWQNATAPSMVKLDMWFVGEVCCTAGTFTERKDAGGAPVIVHGYVNPSFDFTP